MDLPMASGASETPVSGWLKVLVVTFGSFIMVTSEFLPVGLLTRISTDIHKSPGQLGLMVTAPGLTAAVTAPLALLLLHRWDRRYILVGLTVLIALADFLVASVSSFGLILVGRILLGAAVGGFWSYAPDNGNMAVAIVLGGISIGTIVGVPVGAYLGDLVGWRLTFDLAGLFACIIAALQVVFLSALPSLTSGRRLALGPLLRVPGLKMGFVAIVLVIIGHFASYTYLEAFIAQSRSRISCVTSESSEHELCGGGV
jgi:predicted MFS family arabinose efflux permease